MVPLVSVVMSVYNGETHLLESVGSVLNQTFRDVEFVIINDGSTDKTREILESYSDKRIILLNQENMGLTKSLNKGFALAKGKYIARQDVDDVSKPERLEKQVAFMEERPEVGLLGSRFEFIDEKGIITRRGLLPLENKLLQTRLIEINQFCHASAMIRKEAIKKVGSYRQYFRYSQDYDLWLRISEHYEIMNLSDILVQYRETAKAISSEKILIQSLYAGVAREMALQRRTRGDDDIDREIEPSLPPVRALSRLLQEKLTDFYSKNPGELLKGLRNHADDEDLRYLFEQICQKMQRCQAEAAKQNNALLKKGELLRESREKIATLLRAQRERRTDISSPDKPPRKPNDASSAALSSLELAANRKLEEALRQKDEQINALLNSKSWKITSPLRFIYGAFKAK